MMAYTPYSFTIEPRGSETIVATLRTADGTVVRPYRADTVEAADTFTVTAQTVFTLTDGGSYTLSMLVDGLERATTSQQPIAFTLAQPGASRHFTPVSAGAVLTPRAPLWMPNDQGLLGWTYDPMAATNSSTITAGTLYIARMRVRVGTITKASFLQLTAAASLTTAFVALFDPTTKAQLAISASAATITEFQKLNTAIDITFTTPYVVTQDRDIEVGWYTNGGTAATLARSTNSAIANHGLSAATARFATADTGLTTAMPTTHAALALSGVGFWVGLK